ncbi:unnamed protein product [Bursaphelenchus okinawaensis]|uniref:Mos1 transposase HTH domain-containing protein n=1 Tax=Bursaphelenchus okinawaensis TaxID=465554 RepID=A0A811JSQ2_9BILA|nr:unnamed protein product [Bursaphelenchus okinawaensis]CAG9081481.1 unnamed protein product [Bursaphelenchus okinawaensis]
MIDHKYRMRICMLYDFKQGKSAVESHRTIAKVFGKDAYSYSQCLRWFKKFKDGDESLEDQEHIRRSEGWDKDQTLDEEGPGTTTSVLETSIGKKGSSKSTTKERREIRKPKKTIQKPRTQALQLDEQFRAFIEAALRQGGLESEQQVPQNE